MTCPALHDAVTHLAALSLCGSLQMAGKIAAKKLPTAALTLVGSGTMEWRGDKRIDVSQGMAIRQHSL